MRRHCRGAVRHTVTWQPDLIKSGGSSPSGASGSSSGSSSSSSGGTGTAGLPNLAGNWFSNYGPAMFSQTGNTITATITYSSTMGSTQFSGTYNAASRVLSFTYHNSFGDSGNGQLTLSPNGCSLSGSYQSQQDRSNSGPLALTRSQNCG